ncbi:hypothetical protein [Paraburkholderia sp. BCC1886]|uniref:hypothetical protein n=1 Tax=Paraburkholderia sp. BCC1886 TaxID=2562670 RepID=UPI00118318AA|nr:hypothetical protein [Paraburkholderia sp. BCC1886]
MRVVDYKQLCKLPDGSFIATINKMNETGELLLIDTDDNGERVLYSPRSDIDRLGQSVLRFEENLFSRNGRFKVYTEEDVREYRERLLNALNGTWNLQAPTEDDAPLEASADDESDKHDGPPRIRMETSIDDAESETPARVPSYVAEDEEDHYFMPT